MRKVLYVQNGEHDHPGLFQRVMGYLDVELDVLHAWQGKEVPASPEHWHGVVIGGGYMSAYETDEFPFLRDEATLIQRCREAGRPVLGMCLGAQLMAAAFGGDVFANHTKEIGFHEVRFAPAAAEDPLWRGVPQTFRPVHWHGDTFSLPPGAELLASSDLTDHQLYRLEGIHYGVQFHLEIDLPVLAEMVAADDGWLPQHGVDPLQLLRTARTELPRVETIGRAVYSRWAAMLS